MAPTPYLFFTGQCEAALNAYADILGGEIVNTMRMRDGPAEMGVPAERMDWIMHAELKVDDGRIFLSDDFTGQSAAMAGCSVMLEYDTAPEAQAIFDRLADGGTVGMAFEPTFWSAGFGTVTDRFGVNWMVGTAHPPS